MNVQRLTLWSLIAIAAAAPSFAQQPDTRREQSRAESEHCQTVSRDGDGKLDVRKYTACISAVDKSKRDAEQVELRRVRDERIAADLASPDQRKRDSAECQLETRTLPGGKLDVIAFSACLSQRDAIAREAERAEHEQQLHKAMADMAAARARDEAEKAEATRRFEAQAAERRAREDKLRAEYEADVAAAERKEEQRKTACGIDYMRIAVGMQWTRVRECAGPFGVLGQITRPAGVVSIYRASRGTVAVLNGRVLSWVAF